MRRLRNLTRYRVQLMGDRTRDAGRLEKLLEDASIKLSSVASNITGTSSREMLAALVDGERDPAVMADMAHSSLRRKIPDLTEALIGRFDEHHALLVGAILRPSWTWSRRRWSASTRRSPPRWRPGRTSSICCSTIPGVGLVGRAGVHRRDRRGHVPVPLAGVAGRVGRCRACGARVRRQAHPRRHRGAATSG